MGRLLGWEGGEVPARMSARVASFNAASAPLKEPDPFSLRGHMGSDIWRDVVRTRMLLGMNNQLARTHMLLSTDSQLARVIVKLSSAICRWNEAQA